MTNAGGVESKAIETLKCVEAGASPLGVFRFRALTTLEQVRHAPNFFNEINWPLLRVRRAKPLIYRLCRISSGPTIPPFPNFPSTFSAER